MNKNAEFLRQTKIVKTVAGIVSIVSAPIVFVQAILLFWLNFHGLRMFNQIVMSSMLLAGGITMLAGRSKLTGGTENIVLFAIGLGFGLIGFGRLWYWAVWAALCLAASIYFRVNSRHILCGGEVPTVPYEAAGNVVQSVVEAAQDAADRFRAQQPQHQEPQYQQPQQPGSQQPQQPYVPQAAQAAERGYTSPFTVQPTKTMAELQQEVLARKAAEQPAEAAQPAQTPQTEIIPQAETVPPQQ